MPVRVLLKAKLSEVKSLSVVVKTVQGSKMLQCFQSLSKSGNYLSNLSVHYSLFVVGRYFLKSGRTQYLNLESPKSPVSLKISLCSFVLFVLLTPICPTALLPTVCVCAVAIFSFKVKNIFPAIAHTPCYGLGASQTLILVVTKLSALQYFFPPTFSINYYLVISCRFVNVEN